MTSPNQTAAATQERVPFLDLASMHDEIRPELDAAWHAVTSRNGFVGGALLEQFEKEWAAYCGREYCVGVGNGTDSLIIALRAAGIGPGQEVVLPANTFIATAEAIVAVGAQPVFTDVDPDTLLMTAAHLEAAITARTTAVMPVHLYGQPVAMDDLCAVAQEHGLFVLEDAAQAHGATWQGKQAGSFGQVGSFSFYPGKNLGAFGDGGAIVTDDPELAATARWIGNHGAAAESRYIHRVVGGNSRLDALQAAILSIKLTRLDAWNEGRNAAAREYNARLRNVPGVKTVKVADGARSSYHLYVVRVADRARVQAELGAQGIDTGIHYPIPCHLQEPYRQYASGSLPVVEAAAEQILTLPMSPHLTEAQVSRVCDALERAVSPR